MNTREAAAEVLHRVIHGGESLSIALSETMPNIPGARDRAFLQSLAYGVSRWYWDLDFLLRRLTLRPIKDSRVRILALLGLFQLKHTRVKPHAAVAETVAAAGRAAWAKPLLNAVLRGYQRDRDALDAAGREDESAACSHPDWLIRRLRTDWPERFRAILTENNREAPMSLRVNRRKRSRDDYLGMLRQNGVAARAGTVSPDAVILDQPKPVSDIPGFADGTVSVQDEAAQLAAALLRLEPGQRVLDVCAAPGGKTLHLLEAEPGLRQVVALDISAERAQLIHENLQRSGLEATVLVADAAQPPAWWDEVPFDRILLDAPCSATGVIRRHPDIKLLRKDGDIESLAARQRTLLEAVWPALRAGGLLLYATCSVMKAENERIIAAFLQDHADAREIPIQAAAGHPARHGWQILPGDAAMDGFFYARLTKLR